MYEWLLCSQQPQLAAAASAAAERYEADQKLKAEKWQAEKGDKGDEGV